MLVELGRIAMQLGDETAMSFALAVNDAFARGEVTTVKDAELRLRNAWRQLAKEAGPGQRPAE